LEVKCLRLGTRDELCSGCRVCLLVCSLENFGQNNPKMGLLRVEGKFPKPGRYEVHVCDQCGVCRDVCPVEAIREIDGVLRVDEALCTQCMACVEACPRGVMTTHAALATPKKCVLCGACAQYCPTGAIFDADTVAAEDAWRITRGETVRTAGGESNE
jgi:Fe-S-cluster-containing hydrogenase component 2